MCKIMKFFIEIILLENQNYITEEEMEKEIFRLLVHSPDDCYG